MCKNTLVKPTIPTSLQPSTMAVGAITVAEQRALEQPVYTSTSQPTVAPTTPSLTPEQQAQNLAVEWVNRKLQGQRIVRVYYGSDPSQEVVYQLANQYYKTYIQNPSVRTALFGSSKYPDQPSITESAARSRELGFGTDIGEYRSATLYNLPQQLVVEEQAPSQLQPGQPVYVDIEQVDSPTATVYTTPSKTGPSFKAQDLGYGYGIQYGVGDKFVSQQERFVGPVKPDFITPETPSVAPSGFVDTPTRDQQFFGASIYGGPGTMVYREPTPQEQAGFVEGEKGTFKEVTRGAGALLLGYQRRVVEPLAESKPFKWYEEKVVEPLSETVVVPLGKDISKGVKAYQEGVVRPLAGFIQQNRNPLTDISRAKIYMERLNAEYGPDYQVQLRIGSKMKNVKVGEYTGIGLIEFMQKLYGKQVEASWKEAALDLGATEQTAGYVGVGAKYAQEYAPYLIGNFFETKTFAKMGEASIGRGVFGGARSGGQYALENPIEVALASIFVIGKGASLLVKKTTTVPKAYQKYVQSPEKIDTNLKEEVIKFSKKPKTIVKGRQQTAIIDRTIVSSKTTSVQKGTQSYKQFYKATGNYGGTIKETVIVNGKKEVLRGLIKKQRFGGGVDVFTIKYTNGIKKVITVKNGKVTTELFGKSGRLIVKETRKLPAEAAEALKEVGKAKTIKAKFDANQPQKYSFVQDKVVSPQGKTSEIIKIYDRNGNLLLRVDKNYIKQLEKLTGQKINVMLSTQQPRASLITGRYEGRVSTFASESGLRRQVVVQEGLQKNVITSGPRKGKQLFQEGIAKSDLSKKAGVKIKIGTDTTKDITLFRKEGARKVSQTLTQPTLQKDFSTIYGRQVVSTEINPFGKTAKEFQKETSKTAAKKARAALAKEQKRQLENLRKSIIKADEFKKLAKAKKEAIRKAKNYQDLLNKAREAKIPKGVITQTPTPSYVGGPGGEASYSSYSRTLETGTEASGGIMPPVGRRPIPGGNILGPPLQKQTVFVKATAGPKLIRGPVKEVAFPFLKPQKFFTGLSIGTKSTLGLGAGLVSTLDTRQVLETRQDLEVQQDVILDSEVTTDTFTETDVTQDITTVLQPVQETITEQETTTETGTGTGVGPTIPRTPTRPEGGTPRIIGFGFDFEKQRKPTKETKGKVYDVYVKPQGSKKFVKVNESKEAYTKEGALDKMARFVDNTLSAQGKIVPKKKTKRMTIMNGDGYYGRTKNKFREFKIVKGKKVKTPNKFIERRGNRIDTRGEINKVTVAQRLGRKKRRGFRLF